MQAAFASGRVIRDRRAAAQQLLGAEGAKAAAYLLARRRGEGQRCTQQERAIGDRVRHCHRAPRLAVAERVGAANERAAPTALLGTWDDRRAVVAGFHVRERCGRPGRSVLAKEAPVPRNRVEPAAFGRSTDEQTRTAQGQHAHRLTSVGRGRDRNAAVLAVDRGDLTARDETEIRRCRRGKSCDVAQAPHAAAFVALRRHGARCCGGRLFGGERRAVTLVADEGLAALRLGGPLRDRRCSVVASQRQQPEPWAKGGRSRWPMFQPCPPVGGERGRAAVGGVGDDIAAAVDLVRLKGARGPGATGVARYVRRRSRQVVAPRHDDSVGACADAPNGECRRQAAAHIDRAAVTRHEDLSAFGRDDAGACNIPGGGAFHHRDRCKRRSAEIVRPVERTTAGRCIDGVAFVEPEPKGAHRDPQPTDHAARRMHGEVTGVGVDQRAFAPDRDHARIVQRIIVRADSRRRLHPNPPRWRAWRSHPR